MLITIAAVALLLQGSPTPPAPPMRVKPPKMKVHAPEPPRHRWSRDDDARDGDATRDTTFAVRSGQRLSVDNFSGSITVTTWSQDRIRISAPGGSDPFTADGGSVNIRVNTHDEDGGPGDSELTIQVPTWMELDLSGNEVDISTRGSRAPISASTVEGSIHLDGGEGTVEATSVEGDVVIANVRGRVQVSTTEGSATVSGVSGTELDIETVDGDIEMTDITVPNIDANTVDGNIRWTGSLAAGGTYRFATHDGDVRLGFSADPDASVSVETFDGSLDSDFPVTLGHNNQHKITFTLGTGRARLELSSFDGTISLKRGSGR